MRICLACPDLFYIRTREVPIDMQASKPVSRHKRRYYIAVFLAPAVIVYTVFMIIPLLDSLRLSFFTITLENKEVFNGLNNYIIPADRSAICRCFQKRPWGTTSSSSWCI